LLSGRLETAAFWQCGQDTEINVTARTLAGRTAVALILGIVVVMVCYWLVDRPVAWFVHHHGLFLRPLWQWPPLISDHLKAVTPLAIIIVALWWICRPGGRIQAVLLAISVNLVATTVLKQLLKWGCGRFWPETWKGNNPSLIGNGAYGFHPFHYGTAYESFPSGHAAVICSVLSILWLTYPRWRWWYAIVGGAVCLALVGMNYHFVGDVIAGAMLGSITGVCMTHLFRLQHGPKPAQRDIP
jgi:membrane-associated phospholipid phosphatase